MDARLSDDQHALCDTIARLAADLGPRSPADLPATDPGAAAWAQLAEMGLLGMRLPASAGGMSVSGVEVVLAAEALGKRLVPLPFIGSAVCASSLAAAAGAAPDLLASLADGSCRLAPALDPTLTRLARRGEGGVVWEARGADACVVIDRATTRLVALRPSATPAHGVDLTRELRPLAADAAVIDIGNLGGPLPQAAIDRTLALTLAALSADLVGVMQAALDAAVAHVRDRVQFGVPVGTFQAVQHMAAEAHVSVEAARGLALYAGWAVDELGPAAALLAARTAKAYCSEHGRAVVETAMQMHGGVAFTWEYMVHIMVRRALLDRQTLGDEHWQLDAIAAQRALPRP